MAMGRGCKNWRFESLDYDLLVFEWQQLEKEERMLETLKRKIRRRIIPTPEDLKGDPFIDKEEFRKMLQTAKKEEGERLENSWTAEGVL